MSSNCSSLWNNTLTVCCDSQSTQTKTPTLSPSNRQCLKTVQKTNSEASPKFARHSRVLDSTVSGSRTGSRMHAATYCFHSSLFYCWFYHLHNGHVFGRVSSCLKRRSGDQGKLSNFHHCPFLAGISAVFQQIPDHGLMTALGRIKKRCTSPFVGQVHICIVANKQFHQVKTACISSQRQRVGTVGNGSVHLSTMVNKQFNNFCMA